MNSDVATTIGLIAVLTAAIIGMLSLLLSLRVMKQRRAVVRQMADKRRRRVNVIVRDEIGNTLDSHEVETESVTDFLRKLNEELDVDENTHRSYSPRSPRDSGKRAGARVQ